MNKTIIILFICIVFIYKRMLYRLILYAFLFYNSVLSFSQEYNPIFTHINNNQIAGRVRAIIQDSEGYIWFNDNNGLIRYDGYSFLSIPYNKSDTLGLTSYYVRQIVEDNNKRLWISTSNGLNCFDLTIHNFVHEWITDRNVLRSGGINILYYDKEKSEILIKNKKSLFFFNTNTYKIKLFNEFVKDSAIFNGFMKFGLKDVNNNYWMYTTSNLIQCNPKTQEIKVHFSDRQINSITVNSKNELWVVTQNKGVWVAKDLNNPVFERKDSLVFHSSINLAYYLEDSAKNNWIVSRSNGLYYQNMKKGGSWTIFENKEYDENSISSSNTEIAYIDKSKNIWIGTFEKNIDLLDFNRKPFVTISENYLIANVQSSKIRSMYVDKEDNVWVGTRVDGCLSKFDPTTRTFLNFRFDRKNKFSLNDTNVLSMCDESPEYLWVGTFTGGLNLVNKKTGKSIAYKYNSEDTNSLASNSISALLKTKNGSLLIGSLSDKLTVFHTNKKSFQRIHNVFLRGARLIYETKDGNLWFATNSGLISTNSNVSSVKQYNYFKKHKKINFNNSVNCILEDSKSRLWIGSNNGLCLMNRQNETYKIFETKDGLPSNTIFGILEDENDNLWLSTLNGISKFNTNTFASKNYNVEDGLQDNEFIAFAFCKTKNGQFFLGGKNGFNMFFPSQIKDNPNPPIVHLTNFKIFNKSVPINENSILKKHISFSSQIELTHKQTVFTIEYVAINFSTPSKNQYAYFMEGLDKTWNNVGTKRYVTFTNLNPGIYTFKVKASNNDGVWNNDGVFIKIIILPPWWKTNWFIILVSVFIVVVLLASLKLRDNYYKKKQEYLNNLVKLRIEDLNNSNNKLLEQSARLEEQTEELEVQKEELTRSNQQLKILNSTKDRLFSIIGHDLRNPFNVLLSFSELLLVNLEKLSNEKIEKYLSLILATARNSNTLLENLLSWSKTQTGNLRIERTKINFVELLNEIEHFFSIDLDKKDIQLIISNELNEEVNTDYVILQTIIRNLISNAIKFTPVKGTITIRAIKNDSVIEISVADTGIGIAKETIDKLFKVDEIVTTKGTLNEVGTGLGLMICKEFVEKIGGKIWVESEIGKGTCFKFTVL